MLRGTAFKLKLQTSWGASLPATAPSASRYASSTNKSRRLSRNGGAGKAAIVMRRNSDGRERPSNSLARMERRAESSSPGARSLAPLSV
jgi:hypothetical protein